jgi:16S rRNA (uracil1498-N3)-methyltransferase
VHRFFAPALDPGDDAVDLPRDEAEHLTRVLRLGVGDTIAVFDGRGHEFLARVVTAQRKSVRVQITQRVEAAPEPQVAITLAQAVLKADRMDDIVRDAVMLGVSAVQPIVTKRAEFTVAGLIRGARVDRWKRVALASAKQARRAVLPEIRTPLTLDSLLAEPATSLNVMLVEPGAVAGAQSVGSLKGERAPSDALLLIGPEGGWDAAELAAAGERGFRLITLGHRTLRADAVPVAAISVLQFIWGDL